MISSLQVFDPVLCCSTGVCGPDVDMSLVQFSADLHWLAGHGVNVERFNLGQQPALFTQNPAVLAEIERHGTDALPIVQADGVIIARGRYPSRHELASLMGHEVPTQLTVIASDTGCAPDSGCC